ncbi:transcriptional regulator GlxA family with amidase domain [Kibdelosporangium banguiense]|uniref:Transcriptional regulator GlxA family with amidase domain n=1 Tax=Kibdelosporangium banguiense TaxID=1365924 RepID=A0ABS4TPA2_9PSEU|nr:helix-turn-helix transcriptional regulator [Kibdelosporangium banguiense]MBP2326238.1 transcriptional regulator GlxA family with amidase domain [Kibdelosporangium banguiense]
MSSSTSPLPSTVQRALDFCEQHAGEPISTEDIALAVHTGVRSLQRAFRTHLRMTPLKHLLKVRLDRVHQDLVRIAYGHADGTVSDVAMRWGFTHLGRFAAQYRKQYGCTPVQTLRVARDQSVTCDPAVSRLVRTACALPSPGAAG